MKVKKTVAALCLAAIMATSVGAAAAYEVDGGYWKGGTTGLLGGGTVYSNCLAVSHEYGYAWVENADGDKDGDVRAAGTWAKAAVPACTLRTDYAGYKWIR